MLRIVSAGRAAIAGPTMAAPATGRPASRLSIAFLSATTCRAAQ